MPEAQWRILRDRHSLSELHEAGAPLTAFLSEGYYTTCELVSAGYVFEDFEAACAKIGVTDTDSVISVVSEDKTIETLLHSAATLKDLVTAGFPVARLKRVTSVEDVRDLIMVGCPSSQIKQSALAEGVDIRDALKDIFMAGRPVPQIKQSASAEDIRDALKDLIMGDFPLPQIRQSAPADDIRAALKDLIMAGRPVPQIKQSASAEDTRDAVRDIIMAGFPIPKVKQLASAERIRDIVLGSSVSDLDSTGWPFKCISEFGYPIEDLRAYYKNKYNVEDLLASGVSLNDIKQMGYNASDMINGGASKADVLKVFK